jgi:hypothetical protein
MPFGSKRFLHESTMPAVRDGLQASGRRLDDFAVIPEIIVSTGDTDADREQADAGTRQLLAFYGSTPAYRPVLAAHDWEELQPELNSMSKQGRAGGTSRLRGRDGRAYHRRDDAHHRGLRHTGAGRRPYPGSR